MKKLYKIFLPTLIFAGLFFSCDDELNQLPYDEFATENAYVTAQDFENGLRGVYSALTSSGLYGSSDAGSLLSAPDILADNVTLSQRGRFSKRTLHDYEYNSNSTLGGTYSDAYALIFRANQILYYVQNFEGESKNNVIAEAKALRALAHFNLVTFFGQIPTQSGDANSSLGIAYVQEPDPNIEPARLSVAESYAKILEDLQDAKMKINPTNPVGRMNLDAVNVLLSRVYLYMGEWQNSIDVANQVDYQIAARDNVVGVWEDTNRDGLIFYIPNVDPILGNSIGVTWSQGSMTSLIPEYVTSFQLYNLF
ncbi:MAG: RagB/SusD family nutrient uptake outer membrane protein, partial [Flavobacteriales bacterium]